MSGIFGLIHLDRSPVAADEIQAMRSAMREWGPDGGGTWLDGNAGLGSLILFDTPEAIHEQPPLQSSRGFILTAEARLDNRDELLRELGMSLSQRAQLADGALLLRAYEKWGADVPNHLLGDWSFAAWHPRENHLFLARDQSGITALYYYRDPRRFAFASSRKALLALGIPRRLNESYLACALISWAAHYSTQTIELDLRRLPQGHTLQLQGDNTRLAQYWRAEDIPEQRLRDPRQYVEAYLALYDRAVRDCLRSTRDIGATLSSGLDSGSVTLLAARALREQGRRLTAYTSVPIYDVTGVVDGDSYGSELALAQATAGAAGNVDLVEIRSNDITPVEAIRRSLEIHAEPIHTVPNAYWILDLEGAAQKESLGVLLTGQGGNATISWTGISHARTLERLLKQRRWGRALQLLVYPRLPLPFLRSLRRLLHPGELDWGGTSINPGFARRIGLSASYIDGSGLATNPEFWHSPRLRRHNLVQRVMALGGATWAEQAAAHHLSVRDPTFDRRVLEFGLSIPDRYYLGPDGYDRWIMRSAMQGLMPDEVRLNRGYGQQSADLGQRFAASAAEVEAALLQLEQSELAAAHLSIPRIREVWRSIQARPDPANAHQAMTILARGLAAGLYLVDLERAS